MRRASTSPSIQLFPFLAVLVCAMGALILLLLVTTRKLRQVAVARAAAEAAEAEEAARPVIRPAPKTLPAPTGPTPDELAAREAERATRREAIAAAKKRQSAREAEWQRGVAEAEIALDQRRQRVADTQRELTELREKLQATETNLQQLIDRKSQLKSELDKDSKLRSKVEQEHAELSDAIAAAQKKLAELRRAHADAASKFAFIPYDGASGTTRRPVYIECTSTGIRFQPENQLLDENDLKGFTETFNPLLVASQRLMQYWREQSATTDDPRRPSRPYVLLLVRPKGTISYYVARKMLSQLGDDFGYELIEDDFELQLPPADPLAKAVIQSAVADTLKNRGEMLAVGGRVGEPRLGDVLIGRSEELIEFGTLDDQLAATIHREENPFKKNSGAQGKSFAISRSPVSKDEVSSGAFKSSLAERERRRAQGVPSSLAEMAGRRNGTGPRGPELDADISTGTPGNDSKQPGGTAVADGSPSTRTARGLGGSGLGDPFSREHRATGKSGAGSADSGEQTAADSAGTASGAGKDPQSQTSFRSTGQGMPSGAKAGKIIEIPADSAAALDGAGGTAEGSTGTRVTARRGTPGGKPSGDQAHSGLQSDGGGAPNSQSTGNSNDPTAPRGQGSPAGTKQLRPQAGGGNNSNGNSGTPNDIERAFRKPGSDESDGVQDGNEASTGQPSNGPTGTRGQRGAIKSRSTDPNAQDQPRQYGDNPEARKQLAAASSSKSVMQKRDAARRRWGGSNTGQIGFERKVVVEVTGDRLFIERDDIEVIIEPGTTQEELLEAVLSALDEHSQEWGRPPSKFYWVPYLHFEVYTSGTKEYERLHGPLRDWGIFSEADFKTGERTAKPVEKDLIQPVSESKDTPRANIKSTKKKPVEPAETPAAKSTETTATPVKKSPFSWFKKLGTGR